MKAYKIPIRHQGADIGILIQVNDSNGDAIVIDDLAELYVYIYVEGTETVVKKFSKAGTESDVDALVKVSTTSYRAKWLSTVTKDADPGDYSIMVNIVEVDTDYTSSQKNNIKTKNLLELKKATIKELSS